MMGKWQPIETAPKDGSCVLMWTRCGVDIGWWTDREPDGCQQPGHNDGWWGRSGETAPGRTRDQGFGGTDDWIWEPTSQPTHWMPLPSPPPSCPYCDETNGLRKLHDGYGAEPPEYTCEGCFTAMDDGPGFDDLEPVT